MLPLIPLVGGASEARLIAKQDVSHSKNAIHSSSKILFKALDIAQNTINRVDHVLLLFGGTFGTAVEIKQLKW